MFEVAKEMMISATHRVREHQGGCENIHGHNWKVIVYLAASELDHMGMVVDFKVLKHYMKAILDPMDHTDLNILPPFDVINPTSENMAKYIFDQLAEGIEDDRVSVSKVVVFETDSSRAVYRRG